MGRIKLDLPSNFNYQTEINVRISDINYGGHLGNDSILSIIHESRIRFLNEYGFSEKDIFGLGIIMSDTAIEYKEEVFYGDKLKIEIAVDNFTRFGCDFYYKTSNLNGKIVALAKTGIVFFDYNKKKIQRVPEQVKEYWS